MDSFVLLIIYYLFRSLSNSIKHHNMNYISYSRFPFLPTKSYNINYIPYFISHLFYFSLIIFPISFPIYSISQ